MNKILQQPSWPNQQQYLKIISRIKQYPQLVYPNEINKLKLELKEVAKGNKFIIQGGDCAETFKNFSEDLIKGKLKILLQMSAIIQYSTKLKIVNIGRIAGQYIKPRTHSHETRDGVTLPAYRGDGVNSIDFNKHKRQPNPKRLIQAYHQSASTMNLIRSLIMNGFTDISQIKLWNQDLLSNSPLGVKYKTIVKNITSMLDFIHDSGVVNNKYNDSDSFNLYTSHEAILLDYEKAFMNKNFCCSAHMLWVGDRTRDVNREHIKFISKLDNPVAVKIGPTINEDDIFKIYEKINPKNETGKVLFISRLGEKNIDKILPKIFSKIKYYGLEALWICDPMHGNTITAKNGYKTRKFKTIINELMCFFEICESENIKPSGVHFELTGENVTECLGGINNIKDVDLDQRYETTCDPRLNNEQSLEIAFLIAKLLKEKGENIEKTTH
tara:strand:- start:991 stop:2313 length:1323 start_codon:yes stop_codon:yes gene_type:complete